MTNSNHDAIKKRVEKLWKDLIYAKSPEEKERIRESYRKEYENYKRELAATTPRATVAAPTDSRPSVFQYHDCRRFLHDWLTYLLNDRKVGLETVGKESGVVASALYAFLREGKSLAPSAIRRLIPHLRLSPSDEAFFSKLLNVEVADSIETKKTAINEVQRSSAYRRNNPQESEAWRYLSHWYIVAIREMSMLPGFRADPDWIKLRLRGKVLLSEIRHALEFLEQAGFFEVNQDGTVNPLFKEVSCFGGVYTVALGQFHTEMLGKAVESIVGVSNTKRYLTGRTLALSKKNYEKAVEILMETLDRLEQIPSGDEASDDIYHVGLFAVPLSRGSELD